MSIAFELTNRQEGRAILAAASERFRTAPGGRSRGRRSHYDTFDWRLWRAGCALTTVRNGAAWVVECRCDGRPAGRPLRVEREPAFVWELPPGPLRDRLTPILKMRRLLPLMEIHRSRQELQVLDGRDKTVARLRLEDATVRPAGRKTAIRLPARLVATPVRGFGRAFDQLRSFLESQGVEPDDTPLLDHAYEVCGLVPGDYESKVQVPLEPQVPAHLALRKIHRHLLEVMQRNEPGLRRDLDSEFLHDFRVAVRRTRSALTQIRGVFPPQKTSWFRDEFRWLGGLTNVQRDLDVYLLKLDDYRGGLPSDVVPDLEPLERLLRRRQKAEHRRVVKQLDGDRYRRLISAWAGFLADEESPETPETGKLPVAEVAGERILKAHTRVLKKGRAIGKGSPDEKLHRLRIDCKKLRYLLEFFRGLYPPEEIGAVISDLKALQDNLGDFNDLSVQQGAMRGFAEELAESGAPPATLLALGRLISNLARRQGEERQRFHGRFRRFDRRKVRKRLLGTLEGALP